MNYRFMFSFGDNLQNRSKGKKKDITWVKHHPEKAKLQCKTVAINKSPRVSLWYYEYHGLVRKTD